MASTHRIAVDNIFPTEKGKTALNNTGSRDFVQSNLGDAHPNDDLSLARPIADYYHAAGEKAGALEGGGGTYPRSHLEKAGKSPFQHLREKRDVVGPDVPIMILVRSNAGAAMTDKPYDVVTDYIVKSVDAGADVVRNFHSHNDVRQFVTPYKATKQAVAHFQSMYAHGGPSGDPTIFTPRNMVNFFKALEGVGVDSDSLGVKDASGFLMPVEARVMVKEAQKEFPGKAFGFHIHNQGGLADATMLAAAKAGANFIDVGPSYGGYNAQPAARRMMALLESEGVDFGFKDRPEAHSAATEALKRTDTVARDIATRYQIEPYTDPELSSAEAVKAFASDVVHNTYFQDIDVQRHSIAGGQKGGMLNELKKAGMIDRYEEIKGKMPGFREDIGQTTMVTPVADRVFRETMRTSLVGNPDKNFNEGYAKELTGEAGPVQGIINPAKQRQALIERTQRTLDAMYPNGAPILGEAGAIEKLVDKMQELYAPVRDAERLKLVTMRAEELAHLNKEAAYDQDYKDYIDLLNLRISRAKMKGKDGKPLANVKDVYENLLAEAEVLKTAIANYNNPLTAHEYEDIQRGKASDVLIAQAIEGNEALERAGLSKEQIVKLMSAAGVTTVVASEIMQPGLPIAAQQVQQIFTERKLPIPVSQRTREEDIAIQALFGEKGAMGTDSIAETFFTHRNDKVPHWKQQTPETTGKKKQASLYVNFVDANGNAIEKPDRETLYKAVLKGIESGPNDPRGVTISEFGPKHEHIILTSPAGYDNTRDIKKIEEAVSPFGGKLGIAAGESTIDKDKLWAVQRSRSEGNFGQRVSSSPTRSWMKK